INVQRRGSDDAIEVLHSEQAAMVVQRLNARSQLLRLIVAARINIRDGDQLSVGNGEHLLEQVLAPAADADHSNPDAVIRSQNFRWRGGEEGRSSNRRALLDKFASGFACHIIPSPKKVRGGPGPTWPRPPRPGGAGTARGFRKTRGPPGGWGPPPLRVTLCRKHRGTPADSITDEVPQWHS